MLTPTNAAAVLALSKAIPSKDVGAARDELVPGIYTVDALVALRGTFRIGHDYEQRIAPAADVWGLLAVALSKLNGVTVDALLEAYESGEFDTAAVKAQAAEAVAKIKDSTLRVCKGKVTVEGLQASVTEVTPARVVENV